MTQAPLLDLWVPGIPASFATRGERPWRETLGASVPMPPATAQPTGLVADFVLTGAETGWHAADLDNLCEPLFSVVVNRRGWFGGRRPAIEWFSVSKQYGSRSGVQLMIEERPSQLPFRSAATMLLDGVYDGPLPLNAQDAAFADWVRRSAVSGRKGEQFGVLVQFPDSRINIGEIATGRLKRVIDCLHPLLGGTAGAPEDWRVQTLHVVKGHLEHATSGSVRVAVWLLDPGL